MNIIQDIASRFSKESIDHKLFDLDELKKKPHWQLLAKGVHGLHMKELKQAKVVRRQKKVDVSELKDTIYGAKVLASLGFNRRSILKQTEYQELVAAFRKASYEVPVTVEPTKTELFFSEPEEKEQRD